MPSKNDGGTSKDSPNIRQAQHPGAANRGARSDNRHKNRSPRRENHNHLAMKNQSHLSNQGFGAHDQDYARKPQSQQIQTSPKRAVDRSKSPRTEKTPAAMTVICNRVNLYDCLSKKHQYDGSDDEGPVAHFHGPQPNLPVAPFFFETSTATPTPLTPLQIAVIRAPHHAIPRTPSQKFIPDFDVIDNEIPNPISALVHDKYWAQRRRLFWKFDIGIQLDPEGWYSVTPEVIANHVAQRVASLAQRRGSGSCSTPTTDGFIVLDAFCGCGGNAIAFGKQEQLSLTVCVDVDRSKLRKAAYNACLYEIPKEKLIFVECSSLFLLQHCYKDGVLDLENLKDATNLPNVETEVCAGFFIGGLGMLPQRIDAVFMDPPWGGIDYNSLGKNGYCLEKHMKIKLGPHQNPHATVQVPSSSSGMDETTLTSTKTSDTLGDDFFDNFGSCNSNSGKHHHNQQQHHHHTTKQHLKNNFNQKDDESDYWNGVDLLKVAASATKTRLVIYDMPRNTSKTSLAKGAYAAGYRGNLKLEEHYLNGRLKTVTAYMGADYCSILHHNADEDDNDDATKNRVYAVGDEGELQQCHDLLEAEHILLR